VSASAAQRERLARSLAERGIRDARVLGALREGPREAFVQEALRGKAYSDAALPIGEKQTISQPWIVARMTELLEPDGCGRVLEIGTGSGYQAAILSRLVHTVFTIERVASLAEGAGRVLRTLGITNVIQRVADGSAGWPGNAPYRGILVTAGAPDVPRSLLAQLSEGGRLVIPTGSRASQNLTVVERRGDQFFPVQRLACAFVPLLGREGWKLT